MAAAVTSVLEKLAAVLLETVQEVQAVRGQIEQVQKELRLIRALLIDVDSMRKRKNVVTEWLNQVEDIANKITTVIDTFRDKIEENRAESSNWVARTFSMPAQNYETYKLGLHEDLKKIIAELNRLYQHRTDFRIGDLGALDDVDDLETSDDVDDPEVVGLVDDQGKIIEQLLDSSISRRTVLSIVGTGGLGKTTLAQKVYQSDKLEGHFDCRAWQSISQTYNIHDLLREVLYSVKPHMKNKNPPVRDRDLQVNLKNFLRGKKYLIILDDVWDINLWGRLKMALPDIDNASRVIITTRSLDVAKTADCNTKPYKLRYLTDDEGLALLIRNAFQQHVDPENYPHLLDVAKRLTIKCGGLPLVLVVLGGILTRKDSNYRAWNKLDRTMVWHDEARKKCSQVLAKSYEDLPDHLKSCFLYFAAFPEDYKISGEQVTRMWVAEDFIPKDGGGTIEDRAEECLEELVQSMVEVDSRSDIDVITTVRIHDLLRDVALRKAEEKNFLLVYSNPNDKMRCSEARRLAIHNGNCDQLIMSPNLHTLLCFCNGRMPNCSEQRLLKVVSIGDKSQNAIKLGMFEGLTQLRYLSLSGWLTDNCDQEFFEKVIGKMESLQTLQVSWLENRPMQYLEFPKSAWNIKTLRHVYSRPRALEPPVSAKLTNLQTTSLVWPLKISWEREVPHIPNLRSLKLNAKTSPLKAVVTFLSKLEHLTNLNLLHNHSVLNMRGFSFYNHLQSLTLSYDSPTKWTQLFQVDMLPCHLIYLKIEDYKFQQDIMPVLEKLRCLKVLELEEAFEIRKTTCSSRGFSQLEVLKLGNLSMEEWEIEEGAMPILKELGIVGCAKLGVPEGLQYLTNLKNLEWGQLEDSKADLIFNLCHHVPSKHLYPPSDDESNATSDEEESSSDDESNAP